MNSNNWTAITEALPPKDITVLVAGWNANSTETGLVYGVARLVDDWEASEEIGQPVEIWADDADNDELTFTPTHWQEIQGPGRMP